MGLVSLLGILLLLLGHAESDKQQARRQATSSALPKCDDLLKRESTSSNGCIACEPRGAVCYSFGSLREVPPETVYLDIVDANVTSLEGSPFRRFSQLLYLVLRAGSLASISEHAFQGVEQLKALIILNSSLTFFPADLFRFSPALYEIKLTSSALSDVGRITQALRNSTHLRWLEIRDCPMLTSIGKEDLADLRSVFLFNLSGNSLEYLHPQAFNGLAALKRFIFVEPSMTAEILLPALSNLPATSFDRNYAYLRLHNVRHPSKTRIQVDAYTNITSKCRGWKDSYCLHRCSRPS